MVTLLCTIHSKFDLLLPYMSIILNWGRSGKLFPPIIAMKVYGDVLHIALTVQWDLLWGCHAFSIVFLVISFNCTVVLVVNDLLVYLWLSDLLSKVFLQSAQSVWNLSWNNLVIKMSIGRLRSTSLQSKMQIYIHLLLIVFNTILVPIISNALIIFCLSKSWCFILYQFNQMQSAIFVDNYSSSTGKIFLGYMPFLALVDWLNDMCRHTRF